MKKKKTLINPWRLQSRGSACFRSSKSGRNGAEPGQMLPAGLEPATGILLHPWHLERNKGCKGCVRDRKRRDACDCTPAILYCQKPPEGGGRRGRPGADGINLAQPKAAAQYAGAWSLFRTTLKTCSPVLAGCLFTHHDRRGNWASEPVPKFTQQSCSWHQSWCCEHAGKLQGPIRACWCQWKPFSGLQQTVEQAPGL